MKEFVKFLTDYKEIIASVFCFVLTFISILVKRKPQTIDDFFKGLDDVCSQLPEIINTFERPGNGDLKKEEVINYALTKLITFLHRDISDSESKSARSYFSQQIEAILSTPQKKVL